MDTTIRHESPDAPASGAALPPPSITELLRRWARWSRGPVYGAEEHWHDTIAVGVPKARAAGPAERGLAGRDPGQDRCRGGQAAVTPEAAAGCASGHLPHHLQPGHGRSSHRASRRGQEGMMEHIGEKPSDEARSPPAQAQAPVDAARPVERRMQEPGSDRLDDTGRAVDRAGTRPGTAIAAQAGIETGRPSLAQMDGRVRLARDRTRRAREEIARHAWWSAGWHAAWNRYSAFYSAQLDAEGERQAHPEWVPGNRRASDRPGS